MSEKNRIPMFDNLSDDQKTVSIPYYVHEGEMYRVERLNKRWFIAFVIVLVMLFVTNAGWIIYDHQFETYSYEQDVRSDQDVALAMINSGEGSVTYNGNDSKTESDGPGAENQQQKPDENLP